MNLKQTGLFSRFIFYFRYFFALILVYLCLEAWARYRFHMTNDQLPSGICQHIGLNFYEAYRLQPNYVGKSQRGVEYRTDQYGFRVGQKESGATSSLLMGGDSRTFGLDLSFEKSPAGQLEKELKIKVYCQSLPTGSPAFFRHQSHQQKLSSQLPIPPQWVVYAFDRDDLHSDRTFMADIQREFKWYSPRNLKVYAGGFFWSMAQHKTMSFLKREPADFSFKIDSFRSSYKRPSWPKEYQDEGLLDFTGPILKESFEPFRNQGARCAVLYLPRLATLIGDIYGQKVRQSLSRKSQDIGVDFIDGYTLFLESSGGQLKHLETYFIDPSEGIHFSEKGSKLLSDYISNWVRQKQ